MIKSATSTTSESQAAEKVPKTPHQMLQDFEKSIQRMYGNYRPKVAYAVLRGKYNDDSFEASLTKLPVYLGRTDKLPSEAPASSMKLNLGIVKSVSRFHAVIEWDDHEGKYFVKCLGKNGMLLDGQTLLEGKRAELKPGAALRVGPLKVYFLPAISPDLPTKSPADLVRKTFQALSPGTGLSLDDVVGRILSEFADYEDSLGGRTGVEHLVRKVMTSKQSQLYPLKTTINEVRYYTFDANLYEKTCRNEAIAIVSMPSRKRSSPASTTSSASCPVVVQDPSSPQKKPRTVSMVQEVVDLS